MKSTQEYIEEAKRALSLCSDYRFAKWLGVKGATVSYYKSGKRIIDDYAAVRIAEALKIDPMEVIRAANYEREKEGKRKEFWRDFGRATGAGFVGLSLFLTGVYNAPTRAAERITEYTLCAIRKRFHWIRLEDGLKTKS